MHQIEQVDGLHGFARRSGAALDLLDERGALREIEDGSLELKMDGYRLG